MRGEEKDGKKTGSEAVLVPKKKGRPKKVVDESAPAPYRKVRATNALLEEYRTSKKLQKDKNVTLSIVKYSPADIAFAAPELLADKDVAMVAVEGGGQYLRFLAPSMRGDKEVVLAAISGFPGSYAYAEEPAKTDREVILTVAKSGGEAISLLPESALGDREIALVATSRNPKTVRFFSDKIRSDGKVAINVLRGDRTAVNYLGDDAFSDPEVFRFAVLEFGSGVPAGKLGNDTPYGVFRELKRRGIKFNLGAQKLDLLTLDRDKFLIVTEIAVGEFSKRGELVHRFVDEDDREIVERLLKKKAITPGRALEELKYASANKKFRVIPALLAHSRGAKPRGKESEREAFRRRLMRKSRVAAAELKQNADKWSDDREILLLGAAIDGGIFAKLNDSPFLNDGELIDVCLKNYVPRNVDPPILEGLTNLRLDRERSLAACKRDGRNWFYIPEEYRRDAEIAAEAARINPDVYDALPDDLKKNETVLARRLWSMDR